MYVCVCIYIDLYTCMFVFVYKLIYTHKISFTLWGGYGSRMGNIMVSFAEYLLFYRALLQKRPVILSILLTEARGETIAKEGCAYTHTHTHTAIGLAACVCACVCVCVCVDVCV